MVTLVVHHWVRDFAAWKPVFDEHEDVRRSHGEIEHRIYQDIYNPNRVVIHNDFPSEEAALKLIWLQLREVTKKWKMPAREWHLAKAQFGLLFGERFELHQ